jgi:hypothetical protein
MTSSTITLSPEREALVQWTAGLGATTAEALALRLDVSLHSARARLHGACRAGLLAAHRLGGPALFTVTPAGLRACARPGLACRVNPTSARHLAVCARVAAALERCYPECEVLGERLLRAEERHAPPIAARLARGAGGLSGAGGAGDAGGAGALHRPDLVLLPSSPEDGLPVAIEVELTIKAPLRLREICLAWARCHCVAGVLYIAPPEVQRAMQRAIERARAESTVVVLPFEAIPGLEAADRP